MIVVVVVVVCGGGDGVGVFVVVVDKLTCKLSAWISRDQTRETYLVDRLCFTAEQISLDLNWRLALNEEQYSFFSLENYYHLLRKCRSCTSC